MRRSVWIKDDPVGMEHAELTIGDDHLVATSVALGSVPVPYRLDLDLTTAGDWASRRLVLTATGDGWTRSLVLEARRRRHVDRDAGGQRVGAGGRADRIDPTRRRSSRPTSPPTCSTWTCSGHPSPT